MPARRASAQEALEKEAKIWISLSPAEYDRAICKMLDGIGSAPLSTDKVEAILALSSAALRREDPALMDSRICCAEHLLALVSETSDPGLHSRILLLLLLAWLQLGAVVEQGPDYISATPHLPEGVVLPNGADPSHIPDPILREQTLEAVKDHIEAVKRWNAKQQALGRLRRLATVINANRSNFRDVEDASKELNVAMSLMPWLPSALRQLLESET